MRTFEELLSEHQAKYTVHVCAELPAHRDLPDGTVIGIVAYTHEPSKTRWLKRNALVAENTTAADAARLWLQASYNLPLKRRRDQFNPAPIPIAAKPRLYPDCVYVDIKSTYKTIVNAFGYDVEYRRGRYLSVERYRPPMPRVIAENKRAYASVVALSASYHSVMQKWSADLGRLVTFKVRNMYHQPCLWSLTRDILLGVYSEIFWTAELLYANTDGYIVRKRDAGRVGRVIESWGFRYSIKASGNCEVYGVGSYAIGSQRTLRETRSERTITRPMPSWEIRWLKRRAKAHLASALGS